MKIELTEGETLQVIGALVFLSKMDKEDFGLKTLADKITRQSLNELKKESRKWKFILQQIQMENVEYSIV